jgi:hypothetical protein
LLPPASEMPDLGQECGGAESVGQLVASRQRRLGVFTSPGLEVGFALAPPGVGRGVGVSETFPSLSDRDPSVRVEQTLNP